MLPPQNSVQRWLSGVSCASATACSAVGSSYNSNTGITGTLAERWNGVNWKIEATPNPAGVHESHLYAVSCTGANACTAVGYYDSITTGMAMTLAERWDGTAWAIQSTPNPSGGKANGLLGVSCRASTACIAVGTYAKGAGAYANLAMGWDGTAWAIQSIPNPGVRFSSMSGVSCSAAVVCIAVGYNDNADGAYVTLAERWDGTAWTIQSTPNPVGARFSSLSDVSCTTSIACSADGYYDDSSGASLGLSARWNGAVWAIQSTPVPTGAKVTLLNGVSCTAAGACVAVGSAYMGRTGPTVSLVERRNGTVWVIQRTPKRAGATSSSLSSVSCAGAAACTSVGSYSNSIGTQLTLAERWDGTSWAIQPTP